MEHQNKIIELIKASIVSEKFSIVQHFPYHGFTYMGILKTDSTNKININFKDEPTKYTDKVTSFYGCWHRIDPGNIIYEDYELSFRITFEDEGLTDITLTKIPLKFSPIKRDVGFLDRLKATFLFKKVVKSSIDIDFSVWHGVLSMGEARFNLTANQYNALAKELIDLLKARREADAQREISKIDNIIKGL